ncbi:UDP-N-acetylglucosamine 2-epimerase (non-hydrolyzing) [Kribbella sp. NPDC023855]|uniref:non-hydrolyzing UDP-N-acetylglucosamine 2-epimerase n=1 Tax=Kribbella sp. NPDC023855 TaxID=3154698 RepID=UPI0033CBB942
MKIMTVYGTRPEAIKVAPVLTALAAEPDIESVPVVTGQHREMLDQVNDLFGIAPKHDLNILQPGQTLAAITARIMDLLDPVLAEEAPDAVIVQGDTTTSTAAALAAFYRRIPVVHVEAGLRSGDISSPFPEEANRRLTSQITALHLAPTAGSRANLLREGVDPSTIVVTGNTVIDALLATAAQPVPLADPQLAALVESKAPILLVTSHRRESWGAAMEGVGRALARIAAAHPELTIVLPVHRNPVVREALLPLLGELKNVVITEPLSYAEFATLLASAHIVLTDSGGIQEEAPSLGKPVLVMRENTERPEAVEAGTVRLIGTDEDRVVKEVERLYLDPAAYTAMARAVNPYGDGHATERSVAALRALFGKGTRLPDFTG